MLERPHEGAAGLPKAPDCRDLVTRETVAHIDGKQPQLIEVRLVELREQAIVRAGWRATVARDDLECGRAGSRALGEPCKTVAQQGKASDVPIILGGEDSRLKQNPPWSHSRCHLAGMARVNHADDQSSQASDSDAAPPCGGGPARRPQSDFPSRSGRSTATLVESRVMAAVRFDVYIQPRASRTELAGMHGGVIKIRIAAPAVENAANHALVDFVAQHLGVATRCVRIVSGNAQRRKVLEVSGVTAAL